MEKMNGGSIYGEDAEVGLIGDGVDQPGVGVSVCNRPDLSEVC